MLLKQLFGRSLRSFLAIIPILALFGMQGCTPYPERLTASGLNDRFIFDSKGRHSNSFDDYLSHSRELIQKTRLDLNSESKESIIKANMPFEYRPDSSKCSGKNESVEFDNGILLIHGLTASPYIMQDLGEFFRDRCFLVRSVLLPGHGTRPGDLLDTNYKEWIKVVDFATQSFNGEAKNLFLGGYSIGGALAFHHALSLYEPNHSAPEQQKLKQSTMPIKGLFLFSPALKLKNDLAFLAGFVDLFSDWMSTVDDSDYAAYESFPYNAAAQSYDLISEIDEQLSVLENLTIPAFVALSEDDETIDSSHTLDIFRRFMSNSRNRMQIYTTTPQTYYSDSKIEALQSNIASENILSFSHTSITLPKDDPHYGVKGDYHRCLHYLEHSKNWVACTSDPKLMQAETSPAILQTHVIRQLTYNAHYSKLLSAMDSFLLAL